MKMLFSSSDCDEVAVVKNLLVRAGIACEILKSAEPTPRLELPMYPELWIHEEEDYLAATVMFISCRRSVEVPSRNSPAASWRSSILLW